MLSLVSRRPTRGNDPDDGRCRAELNMGVDDQKQPRRARRANRDPAFLASRRGAVKHRKGERIGKHRHGRIKADTMLCQIGGGLGRVPCEQRLVWQVHLGELLQERPIAHIVHLKQIRGARGAQLWL